MFNPQKRIAHRYIIFDLVYNAHLAGDELNMIP